MSEKTNSTSKALNQVITNSLKEANDTDHVTSITFPALGRGFNNFSPKLVAKLMFQCVSNFEDNLGSEPKIRDVRFAIYPGDDEAVEVRTCMYQRCLSP